MRLLASSVLCVSLLACSASTTPRDAGSRVDAPAIDTGSSRDVSTLDAAAADGGPRVPRVHRAMTAMCSNVRAPGNAVMNASAPCSVDTDCTLGMNGRCLPPTVGRRVNYCSYDECFADTDCAPGDVCRCRESPSDANVCTTGDCTADADCGTGAYCSPSRGFDRINLGVSGFWCHTPMDECIDDADCVTDAGPMAACVWYPGRTHWACSSTGFFPP